MIIKREKRMLQAWSAHDFETTTDPDNLGVRIWTITFRPSETYVKDGVKNSDLQRFFKNGLNNIALLDPGVGVRRDAKDNTLAVYGTSFSSYLKVCEQLQINKGKRHWAFFHNLKNFDGYFIHAGLKKAGYSQIDDWQGLYQWHPIKFYARLKNKVKKAVIEAKNKHKMLTKWHIILEHLQQKGLDVDEGDKKAIGFLWNQLDKKEFTVLLKNSQIYQIKTANLEWRDSSLLFPMMSLKDMGITLEKHYKFEVMPGFFQKGEDYNYLQNDFYNTLADLEKDSVALEYAIQDTFILWAFLMIMFDVWNEHDAPPKLTVASTAWHSWLSGFSYKEMTRQGWKLNKQVWEKEGKKKRYSEAKKQVKETYFPWDAESNADWMSKGLYRGGIVGANPAFLGKVTPNVLHLDVTSMYPSISSSELLLPYGPPLKEKPKGSFVSVGRLTAVKDMDNGNNLPLAWAKSSEGFGRLYLTKIKKGTFWYLTKPEADAFYRTYGPYWNWDDITYFRAAPASSILGDFMNAWFELKTKAKEEGNIALKNASKFPLNGLTGKWGSKVRVPATLSTGEAFIQELEAYYTPLVSFITAYGRIMLSNLMLGRFDKVLYWDTDGAFIYWPKPFDKREVDDYFHIETGDGSKMHTWEVEHTDLTMLTLKAKGYMFVDSNGQKEITLSGFHFAEKEVEAMTFTTFITGFKHTQLQKKRYPEGIILEDMIKEQIELWNYPHGRKVDIPECKRLASYYDTILTERGVTYA